MKVAETLNQRQSMSNVLHPGTHAFFFLSMHDHYTTCYCCQHVRYRSHEGNIHLIILYYIFFIFFNL
jgi:hypothetical protein